MSDLLSVYEDFLKTEKQASANTVSSYLRDVHQFVAAMELKGVDLVQVAARDVEDYANSLIRQFPMRYPTVFLQNVHFPR